MFYINEDIVHNKVISFPYNKKDHNLETINII